MASGNPDDRSEVNERLSSIEQKLQHVPTRDELREDFLTRDEFEARMERTDARLTSIEQRLQQVPTRDELFKDFPTRDELRAQMEETRRHFNVVGESLRDDIRLLAEGQTAIIARLDASLVDRDADRATLGQHDLRLIRLEKHAGLEPPRPRRPRRR